MREAKSDDRSMIADATPFEMQWPRISIVTPSYNQGRYIEEAIESVLSQKYPNLEYIVMDGGSTDNSIEIIEKYRNRIGILRIGRDNGQSAALVEGFNRASGELLGWLNSDDRLLPGALLRIGTYFRKNSDVVFVSGDVNLVDAQGRFVRRVCATRPCHLLAANLAVHRWPQQGCFWRKSAYDKVGGVDPSLQFSMDMDLFIRLTAIGKASRIGGPSLADFRIHERSKTSVMLHVGKQENDLLMTRYKVYDGTGVRAVLRLLWILWRVPAYIREKKYLVSNHVRALLG